MMAQRKIIKIDEEKCDGCGQCIVDCAEGALQLVDGKARIVKDSYCDGFGACLGSCPQDALTIEERDADDFDEEAVKERIATRSEQTAAAAPPVHVCPGAAMRSFATAPSKPAIADAATSELSHWPIQLALIPPTAPFLNDTELLLAADCVPFAMADFHERFLQGRAVAVGCPKLDHAHDYVGKLADTIRQATLRGITIVHMEVPCCTGLCQIVRGAMAAAGREVPVKEVTVSVRGQVLSESVWTDHTPPSLPIMG